MGQIDAAAGTGAGTPVLADMHFHLEFLDDPETFLQEAAAGGIGMLAVSCEVDGFLRTRRALEATRTPFAVAALGAHPWRVAAGDVTDEQLERFEELAPSAAAFGEVGLDFADKHTPAGSHERQLAVFERVCVAADASARAAQVRKPLSIHAVRAADEVLDVLEKTGCLESCACIFHWFSGSNPQLLRAREAGCWFSINPRGIATRRGREYAKLVPADRMLLESDCPEEADGRFRAAQLSELLEQDLRAVEQAVGHPVAAQVLDNSLGLLGCLGQQAVSRR